MKNLFSVMLLWAAAMSSMPCSCSRGEAEHLFGPVSAADYCAGKFEPAKHPDFANISTAGIPGDRAHYLRKETVEALKCLYEAFKKDHPEGKLWVQSSTRNFYVQKSIWERRWREYAAANPKAADGEIARLILRYSSMPGTSRHHWGTDFDLNVLQNGYYEKGQGAVLYIWLTRNAGRFGFCQPYTAGRKDGYQEERWHWSHVPLAARFQEQWNALFSKDPSLLRTGADFRGSASSLPLAPVYVNAVNSACADR